MNKYNSKCILLDIFIPFRGQSGQFGRYDTKNKFIQDFLAFRKKEYEAGNIRYITHTQKISVDIVFHFVKEYRGDLDNLLKSLFDALQEAKVVENDNQIRKAKVEIKEDSLFEGISLMIKNYEYTAGRRK
jgi:Holliday junction resolvase RusA-like endonuclease